MSHHFKKNAGFTLIEMMITIIIVSLILTVLITSQSKYTDRNSLSNLAHEVSLTISQAQAYGSGVREFSPGLNEFSASYGITMSLLGSGSPTAYLYFADRDSDDIYDGDWTCPVGGISECLERVNILRGVYIQEICMIIIPVSSDCGPPGTPRRVDISFNRPNTEAQLVFFNSSGGQFSNPNMIGAKIIFRSPNTTATSSVTVLKTGSISVQ